MRKRRQSGNPIMLTGTTDSHKYWEVESIKNIDTIDIGCNRQRPYRNILGMKVCPE